MKLSGLVKLKTTFYYQSILATLIAIVIFAIVPVLNAGMSHLLEQLEHITDVLAAVTSSCYSCSLAYANSPETE